MQVSFGPISWLLVGELFPLAVRGQAIAVATITNFSSNALVSLALPGIQESFGEQGQRGRPGGPEGEPLLDGACAKSVQ